MATRIVAPEEKEESATFSSASFHDDYVVQDVKVIDMEKRLIKAFRDADVRDTGVLDSVSFRNLLTNFDLGLSTEQIDYIMSHADENSDGSIDYKEFMKIGVEVVCMLQVSYSSIYTCAISLS